MFLCVLCGVDRPHIKNFFPVRVVESLIRERQRAQNHQQNPSKEREVSYRWLRNQEPRSGHAWS